MSILYLGRYEFKMLVEMARIVSNYLCGTGTFDYSLVVFTSIFNCVWQRFYNFSPLSFLTREVFYQLLSYDETKKSITTEWLRNQL